MQHAKDSFLLALRDRLAALNPARIVTVDGGARPAVLAAENESATAAPPLPCAFYLRWGACSTVQPSAPVPLQRLECEISSRSGPGEPQGRGRLLAELDGELARLCDPPRVAKHDHTVSPAADLGSTVFWTAPQFAAAEDSGAELRRSARLAIFFFPEES